MSPRAWDFRIRDMIEAAEDAVRYAQDLDYDGFVATKMVRDAVLHNLHVVGEASNHMAEEIVARYPDLPWDDMRDMRNIVAHEYFRVDWEIVWSTVREDLPPLIAQLRKILDENP